MELGQWNSRTHEDDDGRPMSGGIALGTPVSVDSSRGMYCNRAPTHYNKDAGPFGIFVILLRIAQIVFSLIGFSVMAANKRTIYQAYYFYYYGTEYYVTSTLKFSVIKSFVGLVCVDTLVCFYAIVQLVISIVHKATKGSFISFVTSGACMLTFIFDTVLAYALVAAAGAAADSAAILVDDNECDTLGTFCNYANASIAMSFLAFAVLALCAVLYPVRLLRVAKY